jgi:hypothetical protein
MRRLASTSGRGYGTEHQRLRAQLLASYQPGITMCWRCQQPISDPPSRIHLGHDDNDRRVWRGLEHLICNITAANRNRKRKRPRTRRW